MAYLLHIVADAEGALRSEEWLDRSEAVHRQLRPHLDEDYTAKMKRVFAGAAGMVVAASDEVVAGVAVFRIRENTFDGLHMYVDDLVTDASRRSSGVGSLLMAWLEEEARAKGCTRLKLDSGTQRGRAHRFYFREGMQVVSFHFHKDLSHE